MNKAIYRILIIFFVFFLAAHSVEAQILKKAPRNPERGLFNKSLNTRDKKVKEPRAVRKAKKKQEVNQRKLKKEYAEFVKKSRERSLQIQSPEVRERMINNRKEAELRSIERKKQQKANSKTAARKYR